MQSTKEMQNPRAEPLEYKTSVPLDLIDVGDRIRRDPTMGIKRLAKSIGKVGLLNPITIREQSEQKGNKRYLLLAGEARLEAHKLLERTTIAALVVKQTPILQVTEGHANRVAAFGFGCWPYNRISKDLLIEITENICRHNYSNMETAVAQKRVREQLEPLRRQGRRTDLEAEDAKSENRYWNDPHGLNGVIGNIFGGESHTTVGNRKFLLEMFEQFPARYEKIFAALDKGMGVTTAAGLIRNDIKRLELLQRAPKLHLPNNCTLYNSDFATVPRSLIPDKSLDFLFTDPPYDFGSLHLYSALAKFASRTLKDGGVLVCYAPQYYLDKIIVMFAKEKELAYYWQGIVLMSGRRARIYHRQVYVSYKPLLIFVKGEWRSTNRFFADAVTDAIAPKKILHPFEQSTAEAKHFIKAFSEKAQIVCDPMLGTGTTGIAALGLKRKFIGIEINKDTFEIAKARLSLGDNLK